MNKTTVAQALREARILHEDAVRARTVAKLTMELIENAGRYGQMAVYTQVGVDRQLRSVSVMASWGPNQLLTEAQKLAEASV